MTPSDIDRIGWYEPVKMQYVQLVRLSWSTSLYVYNWWNFPDLDTVSAHGHLVSQSWVNVMGCCLTMPNNHLEAISQEIYKFFLAQTPLKSEMAQAKDVSYVYVYAHVYMRSQTLGHTQTLLVTSHDRHGVSNRKLQFFLTVCSGVYQRKHQTSSLLGPFWWNPPVTCGFPSQRESNEKNSSVFYTTGISEYVIKLQTQ